MVRAAVAAVLLIAATLVVVALSSTADTPARASGGEISDPELQSEIAQLDDDGGPTPTIVVEILTDDDSEVARTVRSLGGKVTGSVDDAVVQAEVPVDQLDALAASPAADFVQAPRTVGHLPNDVSRTEANPVGSGAIGNEVTITKADQWQTAGFTGSGVGVGIIDYFDMGIWNTTEHGAAPTVGNGRMFCQDSTTFGLCTGSAITNIPEGQHGVAVAEIVHDMAPGATIYIATVGTVSDLQAAINWFAGKGVTIVTRSLGSAYDGPGDGTGPLDAVVDSAVSKGITWFNSAGNDGVDSYVRRTVPNGPSGLQAGGYVDFDASAGTDIWLRLDGPSILFDGVRWANDWSLSSGKSDYSVEFWEPKASVVANLTNDHWNPAVGDVLAIDLDGNSGNGTQNSVNASQATGANPLEAADLRVDPLNPYGAYGGVVFMRIKLNPGSSVGASADTMEVAIATGLTELGYSSKAGSAGKPVVDSKNPGLLAVGAVDPAGGSTIADYSSQGPTNDGRIKPDISAPSGITSTIYGNLGFHGTSAAAPTAAGLAALLVSAGQAGGGLPALMRGLAAAYGDLGAIGADNVFGHGEVIAPYPPLLVINSPANVLQQAKRLGR